MSCLVSLSRLNVIFSKFDEVQRSGNMVLSPVSGKTTCPVVFTHICFFCLPDLGLVWPWLSWKSGFVLAGHADINVMLIVFAAFHLQKFSKL